MELTTRVSTIKRQSERDEDSARLHAVDAA